MIIGRTGEVDHDYRKGRTGEVDHDYREDR